MNHSISSWIFTFSVTWAFEKNWPDSLMEVKTMSSTLKSGPAHVVNCLMTLGWLLSILSHGKTCALMMWEQWNAGTVLLVYSEALSYCVHLRSWSPANATGLVWHRGNLRAALYCYFTSPYTVFVLNDVLCDLVVFAEMMKASAWCAALCDCCLLLEERYYFSPVFPKRQQQQL